MGTINRRITVEAGLDINVRTYWEKKITKAKRAGSWLKW
jgi:hypothetical protein